MNPRPSQPSSPTPDPALSELLRSWKVDGALPEGFHREVHRRIAQEPANPAKALAGWLAGVFRAVSLLQRPAFAATYVTTGILLGALSGSRHAQSQPPSVEGDPQVRYVASIDPYQMPRPTAP